MPMGFILYRLFGRAILLFVAPAPGFAPLRDARQPSGTHARLSRPCAGLPLMRCGPIRCLPGGNSARIPLLPLPPCSLALAIGACTAAFRHDRRAAAEAAAGARIPANLSIRRCGARSAPTASRAARVVRISAVPADARRRSEVTPSCWRSPRPSALDLTYASYHDTEPAQVQVRVRPDVRLVRPDASGRPIADRARRSHAGRASATPCCRTTTGRAASGAIRASIGRTFRMEGFVFEIVGVAGERFTGTETGTVTDIFVPTMMKMPAVTTGRLELVPHLGAAEARRRGGGAAARSPPGRTSGASRRSAPLASWASRSSGSNGSSTKS